MEVIRVGMADLKVAEHPAVLTTLGLGSCVGIVFYDLKCKMAGMAHIMLPSSKIATANTNRAKFADTGITDLLEAMIRLGARQKDIIAKIAGGAQMFTFSGSSDTMKIGARNSEATKVMIKLLNIPLISEDIGGNHGRTIEISTQDGRLMVKTIGYGIKYI